MQLSCLQENLTKGLSVVQRAVATRSTLPITQNVLLATDNARLRLSATNLEIAISAWVGAQVEEEGAVTIPARLLTEFVSSLPAARIDMESQEQPLSLEMKCAGAEANVNGQDAEDFPPIPTVDDGTICRITPAALREAIDRVAFAAATEDSRPVLTGVKVEIKGDVFTFAAADGFRLSIYEGKLYEPVAEDLDFILPARALQEANRLAAAQNETVEFTVNQQRSQAMFKFDNVELVSQLVQGTFPDFRQLIPESCETRVVVSQNSFLRATTRTAGIFARDGSGIVRLNMTASENGSSGKIKVSARAEELGDYSREMDAQVEGGDAKIAFNNKYLTEVLEVLGDEDVALETTTPSSPGVIKPADDDAGRYTHVVMPMFVQW